MSRSRPDGLDHYWSLPPAELLACLSASPAGLASRDAAERLRIYGSNELHDQRRVTRLRVLTNQLKSPLLLLLLFAAAASAITGEWVDATLVVAIVVASAGIGYSREFKAERVVEQLKARVKAQAEVLRDGEPLSVPLSEVVPGDVFLLSAGSLVPSDGIILDAVDCFVSEAILTGESFPAEKKSATTARSATLAERKNSVFLGTNVRSGTARCLAVRTGGGTEFGRIAHRLSLRAPETEFDRGIRHFGYLLTTAMLVMVLLVLVINVVLGRPALETLLFSIALAVGLSPELLPAILSINLARGARLMARHGVLVRRLSAIENLGSMDVLCTDKTGTLTEGVVKLEGAYDDAGEPSSAVLRHGTVNALLQTGLANPLDTAILDGGTSLADTPRKLGEVPYDFVRKRLSVIVESSEGAQLITKGAFETVLEASTTVAGVPLDQRARVGLRARCRTFSEQGIRVLAVATRTLDQRDGYGRGDERELDFAGFLTFLDRPKAGVREALGQLARLHVGVKLITGDSRAVAEHVARAVGMHTEGVLTGKELDELSEGSLLHSVEHTSLFVEVDPSQKERVVLALKKMGHVVGFLGDGINDAPAMHAADASLSVETAADVTKEAADFVLLERHLDVIRRGIEEGRRTFANTSKYVLTTTSANLGNMLSMAAASIFLPYLPLLAGQILLNNFLSDIPAIGIADDSVDAELISRPRRWDMGFIGRYMIQFGLLSSLFDGLTFGVLLWLFKAGPDVFRTGWFVESLLTELVIALIVRTERPCFRSRPGRLLFWSTLLMMVLALAMPYLPGAELLGFVSLPLSVALSLVMIAGLYVAGAELIKARFYAAESARATPHAQLQASL
jgi:P-type Mg2+ transporter